MGNCPDGAGVFGLEVIVIGVVEVHVVHIEGLGSWSTILRPGAKKF